MSGFHGVAWFDVADSFCLLLVKNWFLLTSFAALNLLISFPPRAPGGGLLRPHLLRFPFHRIIINHIILFSPSQRPALYLILLQARLCDKYRISS